MANRIQRIILPNTEFSRYKAASELSRQAQVPTARLLQALGDIVDLLDQQALLEVEIRYLDSPPVLLLALPPSDCDHVIEPDELMVLAVTRGGTLVKAILRHAGEGWEWRRAEHLQIPSFDPRRDRALGLYWTRSTMRFRETPDLILVTRQGGTDHVYLNRLTGPQQSGLLHIGNRVPNWMEVCPVGAPVGKDLLAEEPEVRPPAEATSAVAIGSKFFAAIPQKPAKGPVVVNADFVHCLGSHLIFSRSPQTLHCRPLDKTEDKKEGKRRLRDKPVCFCPCPTIENEFRLVVGHESGHLSLMVIVGPETLKDVWSTLQRALETNEGINSFESWLSWTGRELQEPRFEKSRGKVAAILRALLERLPPEGNVDTTLNDNVARLFRQPLSFNEFLPVMRPLRDLIEKWRGPRSCHGAAIVERIYSHLPYALQDVFDLELARHDQELTSSPQAPEPPSSTSPSNSDVKAYAELRDVWKTTRARLLAKKETTALARTALWTEQWLERFVLEIAHPSPQQDQSARVREWSEASRALAVYPKALVLLAPDRGVQNLQRIELENFDASRLAFVQQDGNQSPHLVVGNESQIQLLDLEDEKGCARLLKQLDLPDGQQLSLACDAGGGRVLLVLSTRQETGADVWLYSWAEGTLAKGTIDHLPREMVLLPSDAPDQWWLVCSVADEEIGLLRLSRQGEKLDLEELSRRHLRGKVRSIAAARDPVDRSSLVAFVGTASGYIFGLKVPAEGFSFELAWIYRLHGAIRHLHFRPFTNRYLLLALGAAGEAVVLDRSGQHQWMANLALPPNSGVFLQEGEILRLCLVDVEGNVRLYRETDLEKAWANAQGSLQQVTAEQWQEAGTARWELAEAMRLLVKDPPISWNEFSSLQTRGARISVLRRLAELVAEEGQISPQLRRILPGLLEESRMQELRVLARLSPGVSQLARMDLVVYLLREIAQRTDQCEETDLEHRLKAEDLLAEMVNGLGAGLLRPSRLLESDFEAWWRIPEEVRRDLWVVSALLISGARAEHDAAWALSALVEQATFLGPRAFEVLPLIVSPANAQAAEALHEAIEHIQEDTVCSSACPGRLRELLDGGLLRTEARAFVRLLELLIRSDASWSTFLETTAPIDEANVHLHPALHHLIQWSHTYHSLASPEVEQALVEEQLQDLEQMASEQAFEISPRSGAWEDWLHAARTRFGLVATEQLDHRRRELRRRQWVRLEDLKIERQGPRLASVRARLIRDGVQRHAARVVIQVESSGGGLRALVGDLNLSWTWDQVPEQVEWLGFLEEGAREVTVLSETSLDTEGYLHRIAWTALIPPAERNVVDTLLDRVSALRTKMVAEIQAIRTGVHLLALDEELGAHALTAALLEAGGSHLVKLDDELMAVGPGRAEPAGFTTERLLRELQTHANARGEWKVRRTAGRKRIIVFPAEETVVRLLTPMLRPVFEEVGRILRRLDGLPIFWVLPTETVSAFKAALGTAVRFHALHVLPERSTLGSEGCKELETWASATAGVGAGEAGEALEVFGGNTRLFLAWARSSSTDRQKPAEFLRSSAPADTCLRQELAGVGLHELGDVLAARCSRTRLNLRELREGMTPLETIRSTVKTGRATDLIRMGEELTAQAINNLRSDPGAGRWPEIWVEGYHAEGRSSDTDPKIRPLFLALRRSSGVIQQTHRQLAERQVLSVQGRVAHVRDPFRTWIDRQLALDPTGRTWTESLHGKELFKSLTFEEMYAAGDELKTLCPELSPSAAELAREMGRLRISGPEPKRLENLCGTLTKSRIHPVDLRNEDWVQPLSQKDLSCLIEAGMVFEVDGPQESGKHFLCYYWANAFPEVLQALSELLYAQKKIVVTLFGPGLASAKVAESKGLCMLTDPLLKEVLRDRDVSLAFWRAVRNRTGLRFFSPFQTQNALAQDSPVFVGREAETQRILEGIANTSFLILGGRMIGKTSLLQHVYGKIAGDGKHTALLIDCAGCETEQGFWEKLRQACKDKHLSVAMDTDPEVSIEQTLRGFQRPVLFLNEIDGLSLKAQRLLQSLRGLSENQICQFVMVGYHGAFGGLHDPQHPFYHWVQGERGEKSFFLGPLSDLAARSLIAKLEQPPLEIQWESEQTRSQGYAHLIESTYRIPILLQRACEKLLARLDNRRQLTLRREDLQADTSARPVWKYLQDTRPTVNPTEREKKPPLEEIYWGDLVLAATVEALYYRPRPTPIRDPKLRERLPEPALSFNEASIRIHVRQALERLQLLPEDLQRIDERFRPEAYGKFLDVMTLTVLVAPSPGENRAYHFSEHIYPLELERFLQLKRTTIEDYTLGQAGYLLEVLRQSTVSTKLLP